KPPSVSRPLASWRNGIRRPSLLHSSPSKARSGAKSFERLASSQSDGLRRARARHPQLIQVASNGGPGLVPARSLPPPPSAPRPPPKVLSFTVREINTSLRRP